MSFPADRTSALRVCRRMTLPLSGRLEVGPALCAFLLALLGQAAAVRAFLEFDIARRAGRFQPVDRAVAIGAVALIGFRVSLGLFDGLLFPYRAESQAQMNLTNATLVEFEVQKIRRIMGTNFPVILDVYATAHSRLGGSTVEYVQEVVKRGLRCCDGILIYRHQDTVAHAAKYQVIRTEFHTWMKARADKTK